MLRDLLIGGVLGVTLWGWRAYRSSRSPAEGHLSPEQPSPEQQLKELRKQLAKVKQELAIAVAKRAEAETQISELNQLATDRAIELVQLQSESAALLAQVSQLTQKRPRKKRASKVELPEAVPDTVHTTVPSQQAQESEASSETAPSESLALDLSLIYQKQAETAAAAQLLQPIFTEEEMRPNSLGNIQSPTQASISPDAVLQTPHQRSAILSPAAGLLDEAHASFLIVLRQQPTWKREDLMAIAQQQALLLDGALELINEAALERCGEVLTEGDDPIEVNPDVLGGLLT
ncbi:MAG: hypothetical protein MH252_13330 [Thermosynechococcaceae cyanobacterium MS004]|nr:hypothetical protein [Thermosynechococcaceae cyanobacterium MS004]